MLVYKLKKLKKRISNPVCKLLIAVTLSVVPLLVGAQPESYRTDQGILVGDANSRMFITIHESDNHVEFQMSLLGAVTSGAFIYVMVYDTTILRLTDPTYAIDMPNGSNHASYGNNVISVAPSFTAQHPYYYISPRQHRPITGGEALGMKYFCAEMGELQSPPDPVILSDGEVIPIFTVHYRKVTPGLPLTPSDFGFYAQSRETPLLCSAWIMGAYKIYYAPGQPWDNFFVHPELFTFRSPSAVTTDSVNNILATTATLHATFKRGNFTPTNQIIVSENNSATYTGRLNWDNITQYGFIYSETDATIFVNEFSKKLNIDGTDYDFPAATELAAGEFQRNGKTFYLKQLYDNSSASQSVSFTQNVSGLKDGITYHAWAFIYYVFETSDPYLNVGAPVTFRTEMDMPDCPATVDYQGKTYTVTPLAGLCWTSNMANKNYANGTPIAFAKGYECPICPDSDELTEIFGLLYTWNSAVGVPEGSATLPTPDMNGNIQGICPDGWHVPSQAELNKLNKYSVNDLKSKQYWHRPGSDLYGFDARPAGKYSGETDRFINMYGFTGYWASDAGAGLYAHYFPITYYCSEIQNLETFKADGLSVRCIMDE